MKIITWNVNNRVGMVSQQVQALGQREPDVVALQDVNRNAVIRYLEAFRLIGLSHVMHTLARQSQAVPTGVLIASRYPLSLLPDMPESVLWDQGVCSPDREKVRQHWTRRTLFALLYSPFGEIEVANVYITPSSWICSQASTRHLPSRQLGLVCCAAISIRHSMSKQTGRSSPGAFIRDKGSTF